MDTDSEFLVDGKYGIRDLVNLDQLRELFVQFNRATGFTIGFLDHPGLSVLLAIGWKDLCTEFHRRCPASAEVCRVSNRRLLDQLTQPHQVVVEACEHGLFDCATPIIIKGKHIASLATGQLLFTQPDIGFFRDRARQFGYDETAYLEALKAIRVVSEEQLRHVTSFLGSLAGVISELGYTNLAVKEEQARLEQEMAERERLQQQLTQAQKMESIGRLAGGIAHDFNNILGVIVGQTDLALAGTPADDARVECLREIRSASERSAGLVRQLLAFARKQSLLPQTVDLNEAMDGILTMLRRLIGENLGVEWRPEPGLWPVRVDPSNIDQILANLCVNARDAAARTIHIATRNERLAAVSGVVHGTFEPGEYVRLSVRDDGEGLSAAAKEHLFEPFFTTKGVGIGTGLGLASVYGAVAQGHGFIQVTSQPGQGTTFDLFWPRHAGTVDGTACAAPAGGSSSGGTETVLLVEDEAANLKVARRMLERLGYTVLAASCPGEALERVRDHAGALDLVMTDVVMPEMNGLDLVARLVELRPGIHCLFMSGYTDDVIDPLRIPGGKFHFLHKPFTLQDLARTVRQALG